MVKVRMLALVATLGLSYSLIATAEPLDEQIQKMHELQLQQNTFDENLKSRAERNKIPGFRQKLLDAEKDLDRSDRWDILQEQYRASTEKVGVGESITRLEEGKNKSWQRTTFY